MSTVLDRGSGVEYESRSAVTALDDPAPQERLLSNGRYEVLFTAAGAGRSTWNGLLLTGDGIFIYLRDVEHGTLWSAGHQPVRRRADRYDVTHDAARMTITRPDDGIEATLDVRVDSDRDREIRRLRLRNDAPSRRRIEV